MNIARSVDRMTDFALGQLHDEMERAGLEYGVNSAPTADQLQEAIAEGEPIEAPGESLTTYGKALQKGFTAAAAESVEVAAREDLTNLRLQATASLGTDEEISVDQYSAQLDDLLDGYSAALADADPLAVRKMRAGLAVLANNSLTAYSEKYLDKQVEKQQAVALHGANRILDNLDPVIAVGSQPDAPLDAKLEMMRAQYVGNLVTAGQGDNFARQNAFDQAVTTSAKAHLAEWAIDSPARQAALRDGDVDDPRAAELLGLLDTQERQQLVREIRNEKLMRMDEEERMDAYADAKAEQDVKTYERRIAQGMERGEDIGDVWREFSADHPVEAAQFRDIMAETPRVSVPGVVENLRVGLIRGTVNSTDVDAALEDGTISFTDWRSLSVDAEQAGDKKLTSVLRTVKSRIQSFTPDNLDSPFTESSEFKAAYADIDATLREEYRADPTMDLNKRAAELLDQKISQGLARQEQDKRISSINRFVGGLGFNEPRLSYSPDAENIAIVRQRLLQELEETEDEVRRDQITNLLSDLRWLDGKIGDE